MTMRIVACIDGSPYANAVCDYAAWLTGPLEQAVSLLHVIEGEDEGADDRSHSMLALGAARLKDSGLDDVQQVAKRGSFPETAAATAGDNASMLVAGKRGLGGPDERLKLGSNVEPLLRATDKPVCLVSSVFLPISRCLILLDADIDHRRAVDFVSARPWLAALDADVVVMTEGEAGEAKLSWARERLGASGADIYALSADGPHAAVQRYRREHPIDLLVLSREVALATGAEPLRRIEADSLWAWRAPVLIC